MTEPVTQEDRKAATAMMDTMRQWVERTAQAQAAQRAAEEICMRLAAALRQLGADHGFADEAEEMLRTHLGTDPDALVDQLQAAWAEGYDAGAEDVSSMRPLAPRTPNPYRRR